MHSKIKWEEINTTNDKRDSVVINYIEFTGVLGLLATLMI